jgi:membrane-associated phospholipid phosphatase
MRFFILIMLLIQICKCYGSEIIKNKYLIDNPQKNSSWYCCNTSLKSFSHHPDSIHRLNFRYPGEKKGIKPYIAPALLISAGTAIHFMPSAKESYRDFMQDNFSYHGKFDDYARYAPLVAVYSLNLLGINGQNNFGNMTAMAFKSILLNSLITDRLKYAANITRPNGDKRSFPSGHTSVAFCLAHLMHNEYGKKSIWYSIGAYSTAAAVGIIRTAKNAHWISDVITGAGLGMLSTELIYLTHQYKWDNDHLKRFDIFPFSIREQKGITIVYNF